MVFHVGIDPVWGKISVFNESTKEINDFVIDKVAPDDVHKINAMFEEIETKINGEEIGCVCIYLQQKYNNDIRIKFIEKGTKFGFTDIQIIDLLTLQYLQYIFQAQFKPNFGDIIWIILDGKCYIWEKFEKKAKLIKFLSNVSLTMKEDLLKIKKISETNNPSLIILDSENSKVDENFVEDAFPKCKIFVGGKAWSCAKAALMKARIMAGDSELMEYDADTVLINPMCVKINGKLIFQLTANEYQPLPFSQDFILCLKDGEKMLKIYVDETFYENIKLIPSIIQSKQCKITFYIDTDGIYSIECSSMEPLFSIRHHSTTDNENFDDLESVFETENENVNDTTESGNSETETVVKSENNEFEGLKDGEKIIKNDQSLIGSESQQPEDVIKKLLESFGSEEIESGSETEDEGDDNNVDTDFSALDEGELLHSKLPEVPLLRRNAAISPLPDKNLPLSQISEIPNLSLKSPLQKAFMDKDEPRKSKTLSLTFPLLDTKYIHENYVTEIIATRPPIPPKPKFVYVPNKEEVPNSRLNNAPQIPSHHPSENLQETTNIPDKNDVPLLIKNSSTASSLILSENLSEFKRNSFSRSTLPSRLRSTHLKGLILNRQLSSSWRSPSPPPILKSFHSTSVINSITSTTTETFKAAENRVHNRNIATRHSTTTPILFDESKIKRPNDLSGIITRELHLSWRSPSPPPIPTRFESLINKIETPSSLTKKDEFSYPIAFILQQIKSINENSNSVVGIDFGTTKCIAATNSRPNGVGGIQTLALENSGSKKLQSFVFHNEENERCGQIAFDKLFQNNSKSIIFDLKQILGKNFDEIKINDFWPFEIINIENKPMIVIQGIKSRFEEYPEMIAAILLKHIKEKVEKFQDGKKLSETVLTVPIGFTENQKEALTLTGIIAGFEKVHLLPDPIAAAISYFVEKPIKNNFKLLFFDLGGGALDICLFDVSKDALKVIGQKGEDNLGGKDFDYLLFNYFSLRLKNQFNIDVKANVTLKYKLLEKCVVIKHILAKENDATLDVTDFDKNIEATILISRRLFEAMAWELLSKIRRSLNEALISANCHPYKIIKVLLSGESIQMPMIKKLLQTLFPNAKYCYGQNPGEDITIGAAYYAHYLNQL